LQRDFPQESEKICYFNNYIFFISAPRQCTVCGKLAEFECKDCIGEFGVGLESIAFCAKCLETVSYFDTAITVCVSGMVMLTGINKP
jgi:hypothetical protein